MKTYCQPVFVAPFGHVTSISVVGFHVGFTFAHIPPTARRDFLRTECYQLNEADGTYKSDQPMPLYELPIRFTNLELSGNTHCVLLS